MKAKLLVLLSLVWLPLMSQENDDNSELKVLGIFTDNPIITQRVEIDDTNFHLYLWENTLRVVSTTPYEGENVLPFASNGSTSWFGFGFFATNGLDLNDFANGYLHVAIKISKNATNEFWLGIGGSNNTEGKIEFKAGNDPFNFKRDGKWHKLVIPMRDLTRNGLLLDSCGNYFMMGGGGTIALLAIDDIYFSTDSIPVENPLLPDDENNTNPNTYLSFKSLNPENIVFPTVSNGLYYLNSSVKINSIHVYQLNGQLLKNIRTHNNHLIDLTSIASGMYIIEFRTNTGKYYQKIIKK